VRQPQGRNTLLKLVLLTTLLSKLVFASDPLHSLNSLALERNTQRLRPSARPWPLPLGDRPTWMRPRPPLLVDPPRGGLNKELMLSNPASNLPTPVRCLAPKGPLHVTCPLLNSSWHWLLLLIGIAIDNLTPWSSWSLLPRKLRRWLRQPRKSMELGWQKHTYCHAVVCPRLNWATRKGRQLLACWLRSNSPLLSRCSLSRIQDSKRTLRFWTARDQESTQPAAPPQASSRTLTGGGPGTRARRSHGRAVPQGAPLRTHTQSAPCLPKGWLPLPPKEPLPPPPPTSWSKRLPN
jgi:hypothetical protein